MKKGRESGIELLRILAILGVVLLHYNDGRAFTYVQGGLNKYVLYLIESVCICGVDLFVLISGYFLSATDKRKFLKIIELFIQVILIRELWYIALCIYANIPFSLETALIKMIPNNYFVVFYAVLYIISPYLNRIFAGFTKEQWNRFMITMVMLFSIWPTLVDFLEEIMRTTWVGLSPIALNGSQKGFHIVQFILMYFIGAYLRHQEIPKVIRTRGKQLIGLVLTVCTIFMWTLLVNGIPKTEMNSSWMYHNPLVILLAVLLFVLFKSFTFESKWINELAKAAFTCFLFHNTLLNFMEIHKYVNGSVFLMLGHMLFVLVLCYICSYILFKLYDLTIGKLLKKIPQF